MGMSVPEPKRFPTASAYGNSDAGGFVAQNQQPLFIPPQQFASLDTPSADPNAASSSKTTINIQGRGHGKFFGDDFDPAVFGKKKAPAPGTGPKFPNPAPPIYVPPKINSY